jgi:hypothetical protein
VLSAPSAPTSAGPEAVRLAELAGVTLFPWQVLVCEHAMAQTALGRWAAFEVCLIVSRQNGKGTCLEVMELHALFVLGVNVYHTAHVMKTARKAYKRLWALIEATPILRRRVAGKPHITAEEITITLTSGAFITYMARGQRAGRGLDDCDVLVLDEALFLEPRTVDAILPAMTTRRFAQVWYTSSAGVLGSAMLRRLRARGEAGESGLVYLEWSVPPPTKARPLRPRDPELIAMANPSLGEGPDALITLDYVLSEQGALTAEGYARERLGVWDEDPAEANRVIPAPAWNARGGETRRPPGEVAFAVAGSWPDPEWCSIVVAGRVDVDDTVPHPAHGMRDRGPGGELLDVDPAEPSGDTPGEVAVQLVDHARGTGWVIDRMVELDERWENCGFVIDPAGTAGFLAAAARDAGLVVHEPTARDVSHWSADFRAAIGVDPGDEPTLRHYDYDQSAGDADDDDAVRLARELTAAATSAGRRPLEDRWTWQRRGDADIGPVEAASLAVGGLRTHGSVEAWAAWE